MKEFIVKDTIINLETKTVSICYTGKDGYVHDFPEDSDGWKRKSFAEKSIEKEMNLFTTEKLTVNVSLESKKWIHIYEIIEK